MRKIKSIYRWARSPAGGEEIGAWVTLMAAALAIYYLITKQ